MFVNWVFSVSNYYELQYKNKENDSCIPVRYTPGLREYEDTHIRAGTDHEATEYKH
jgi:hypothetical protein